MSDTSTPAYLVVCGRSLGREADPEYGRLAAPAAEKAQLKALAFGEEGSAQMKLLEGEIPPGVTFFGVEEFPSMAALEEFWFSAAYQSAIPFRSESFKLEFVVAVDGISEAQRKAAEQAAE